MAAAMAVGAESYRVGDFIRAAVGQRSNVVAFEERLPVVAGERCRVATPLAFSVGSLKHPRLQRFGDPCANIAPRLFIHRRRGRLVETLPAMQHDPNRPEDVLKVDADEDGVGGDDAVDALRYLVATKARTVTQRKLRGL